MKQPPASCPDFDNAIECIEAARKVNGDLREWGEEWRDKFYELEKDHEAMKDSKNDEISRLKDEIDDLEHKLKDKSIEINSLQDDVVSLERQLTE